MNLFNVFVLWFILFKNKIGLYNFVNSIEFAIDGLSFLPTLCELVEFVEFYYLRAKITGLWSLIVNAVLVSH